MLCPSCGYGFRMVECQCRGQIIRAEAWKLGRWDLRPIDGSLGGKVRPMDIDVLIERNGKFLVYETKAVDVPIPVGQRLALEALSRIPQFTVATLWGEPDEPEYMQQCVRGIWRDRRVFDSRDWWDWTADWWLYADRGQRRTG